MFKSSLMLLFTLIYNILLSIFRPSVPPARELKHILLWPCHLCVSVAPVAVNQSTKNQRLSAPSARELKALYWCRHATLCASFASFAVNQLKICDLLCANLMAIYGGKKLILLWPCHRHPTGHATHATVCTTSPKIFTKTTILIHFAEK